MTEEYFRPDKVEEAVRLKEQHGENAVYFAGGTEINRLHSPVSGVSYISLENLPIHGISTEGGKVIIGATVTLQDLIDSDPVPPVLKQASRFCASRTLRNMATVGGNICAGRDDSWLIPCLLALKARLRIISDKGIEEIDLWEYLRRKRENLVLTVIIPDGKRPCAIKRAVKSAHRSASVSVAVGASSFGPTWSEAAADPIAAFSGSGLGILRLEEIERRLGTGSFAGKGDLERSVQDLLDPRSDITGSAEYKRYIGGVLTADAVEEAGGFTDTTGNR